MKILQQSDTSIVKLVYRMLKEDADRNISYNGKNWAWQIKSIFEHHGLGYVWCSQTEPQIPFLTIKKNSGHVHAKMVHRNQQLISARNVLNFQT